MTGYNRYPLEMRHPHAHAAVISDDRKVIDGREVWRDAPPGKAATFQPVTVQNEEQEDYHASLGYVPNGQPNPAAFARATIAPEPPGYVHHEYPRMLPDGMIDEGPDAPKPPDNYYPAWVRMKGFEPTLVQDAEAHRELLKDRGTELPAIQAAAVDDEIAELEKKIAALREKRVESPSPAALMPIDEPIEAVIETGPPVAEIEAAPPKAKRQYTRKTK